MSIEQITKQFWNDVLIKDSSHSDDLVIWYKNQFYAYAKTGTEAKQKVEFLLNTILKEVDHE